MKNKTLISATLRQFLIAAPLAGLLAAAPATQPGATGAGAAAGEASANLIVNGGFEDAAGDKPRGWAPVQAAAPTYVQGVAGADVRTGTRALKLENSDSWHNRWSVNNAQRPRIEGGRKYRLSTWVKAQGVNQGNTSREFVQLRSEFFDESGKILKPGEGSGWMSGPKERPDDGQWAQVSFEFTAPTEAKMARPLLVLSNGGREGSTASATFDDVTLEKVE